MTENPFLELHSLAKALDVNFESIKLHMQIAEPLRLVSAGAESRGIRREPIPDESQDESAAQHRTPRIKREHTPVRRSTSPKPETRSLFIAGVSVSSEMLSSESWSPQSHVG